MEGREINNVYKNPDDDLSESELYSPLAASKTISTRFLDKIKGDASFEKLSPGSNKSVIPNITQEIEDLE